MPRPPGPLSAQEALSPLPPGTGLMGVASEECQERGETGAGAAAAVATGEGGSGEGGFGEEWCHTRGWVVRKNKV